MKRLSRKLAHRWTHEVAAWLEYERINGAFPERYLPFFGFWNVGAYLAGACWIASFILRRVIEARGYRAGVLFDPCEGHAEVVTACGWRLDPTWMQFADEYETPHEPYIERRRLETEHGLICMAPCAMLRANGEVQGPSWPGYYREVIERVLRRMGVDGLEAA